MTFDVGTSSVVKVEDLSHEEFMPIIKHKKEITHMQAYVHY